MARAILSILFLALTALACWWIAAAAAQDRPLVRIPFHVAGGQSTRTLTADRIILLEDGQPREPALFETGEGAVKKGAELVLLFRTGPLFRMKPEVKDEHEFDRLGFQSSVPERLPYARFAVYGFDKFLMPFCAPARDTGTIQEAIAQVVKFSSEWDRYPPSKRNRLRLFPPPPGSILLNPASPDPKTRDGEVWLYRAIIVAAQTAVGWRGDATRVILVFSNPVDNLIPAGGLEASGGAVSMACQLGIPLYPVLLESESGLRLAKNMAGVARYERNRDVFLGLGEATGGLAFSPKAVDAARLTRILTEVAEHIRSGYVAGFQPAAPADQPKPHKIEVRLKLGVSGAVVGGPRTIVY
jgi:hypothetical protein